MARSAPRISPPRSASLRISRLSEFRRHCQRPVTGLDAQITRPTGPRRSGTIRESSTDRLETETMQTHGMAASTAAATNRISVPRPSASQKVLIVNGSSDVLEVLEPVLEAGNYDVVFVESSGHAYSQIRRVQPDLVILCVQLDDVEGLHVLSMLKLDAETRNIPVVTYTSP